MYFGYQSSQQHGAMIGQSKEYGPNYGGSQFARSQANMMQFNSGQKKKQDSSVPIESNICPPDLAIEQQDIYGQQYNDRNQNNFAMQYGMPNHMHANYHPNNFQPLQSHTNSNFNGIHDSNMYFQYNHSNPMAHN